VAIKPWQHESNKNLIFILHYYLIGAIIILIVKEVINKSAMENPAYTVEVIEVQSNRKDKIKKFTFNESEQSEAIRLYGKLRKKKICAFFYDGETLV
jgi:hypothetical protein